MADINHRARKILAAVVQEYLATGDAVGSRTITRRYGVDLSPATVRNVMSDLEDAGLLKQPHTSAGRVPTDVGLRFFVDSLLKVRSLTPRERDDMQARFHLEPGDLDTALRDATRQLAELSTHTVVLVTPGPQREVLEHVEFMRMRDGQLLAVLVTKSGQVQNKLVMPARPITNEQLERIHNYLNETLGGLTLDEVRTRVLDELQRERSEVHTLEQQALELQAQALPHGGAELLVEGQARLLEGSLDGSAAEQLQKMKALLRALEEKGHVAELLERTASADRIQVFIGAETNIEELADFTIIAKPYGEAEGSGESVRPLGTLGVIGPTRMNYSKVISLVDFTAQLVSELIRKR